MEQNNVDTTQTITHLSLCAGYGGIDLGLRSVLPSRPEEDQHYWEYPRTIGSEEVITAMGGSAHGIADGELVRNQRIDSLRALGNGVVPATAARAFVILMDRLGGGTL